MYIYNSWYAVADSRELGRRPLALRRFGLDLVLWRDAQGTPRSLLDRCVHRGAALSLGRVREGTIECPFHGFRFDGEGACVKVPCNGPDQQRPRHLSTRSFELREAYGFIWLWWGEAQEHYPDLPWFEDLDHERCASATHAIDTQVGWMRNVENQLDFAHLPFVHRSTIGGDFPPEIEVRCEVDETRLECWVAHEEDGAGEPGFKITFLFANLWQLPINPRMRNVAAFAPIDETRSRLYLRTYIEPFALPGFASLVARVSTRFNAIVLAQDLRIVETQPPGPTAELREEKLVQSDLPIARFRQEVARRSRPPEPGELVQLRRSTGS